MGNLTPPIAGQPQTPPNNRLAAWVTYNAGTVVLGSPQTPFFIDRINLHVQQAFNAGTSNNISVGYTGSQQAFGTNTSVGTTGRKTVTMGSAEGLNTTARTITAYYAQTGAAATAGKAFVEIFFTRTPPVP